MVGPTGRLRGVHSVPWDERKGHEEPSTRQNYSKGDCVVISFSVFSVVEPKDDASDQMYAMICYYCKDIELCIIYFFLSCSPKQPPVVGEKDNLPFFIIAGVMMTNESSRLQQHQVVSYGTESHHFVVAASSDEFARATPSMQSKETRLKTCQNSTTGTIVRVIYLNC